MPELIGSLFGALVKMTALFFVLMFMIKFLKFKEKELHIISFISAFVVDVILVATIAKDFKYLIYDLIFIPVWLMFYLKRKIG